MTRVHQFNFHNFTEDAECHRILNKMRIDIQIHTIGTGSMVSHDTIVFVEILMTNLDP